MTNLIEYRNVKLCQAEQIVLQDVNLAIAPGEFVYLLGKVGTGKSTFLKSLYGALPVDKSSEKAMVLDYDMLHIRRRRLPYLRRRLGVVFQDYQLLTDRSVEDNLMFVLRATGWKKKATM